MNYRSDYFIFVMFSIIRNITSQNDAAETFDVCPNLPKNLEMVAATVYFNGCTVSDYDMFCRICSWKDGFPCDVLSLTLKVGGEMTSENNEYTCWSENIAYDCTCTFQHACLSQLMDPATFLNFMCCTVAVDKTLTGCITEFGMDEQLAACMNGETDIDPIEIALSNAQEVLDTGVNLDDSGEPLTLFTETFDYCVDTEAFYWWAQSVCSQLTKEKFDELENCQEAFDN